MSLAGSGAPMARGLKKSRGLRKWGLLCRLEVKRYRRRAAESARGSVEATHAAADALEFCWQSAKETHERDDFCRDRSGRPRGKRRASVRPLSRGVRGRRRVQALAREDRDGVRRSPVLPDHDEPSPAAPQRRLREQIAAGPQRGRGSARVLAGARHVGQRRQRQGDREPRHRRTEPPRAGLPWRHALLRVGGAGEEGVALQARPRHREGAHTRAHQDGVLVAEFKRLVLVPRKHPGEA